MAVREKRPQTARRKKSAETAQPIPWAQPGFGVSVHEVKTEHDLELFISLPHKLFRNEPNFMAPLLAERRDFLDKSRNPFFKHARAKYFLAQRKGQIVGRIAAVIDDAYNRYHQTSVASFGFFDSVDEPEVASTLFQAAAGWVQAEGFHSILGPMNFAFHHDCGLLVEGHDTPMSIVMPYNPPYYQRLFELNGFRKCKDLLSYELLATQALPEKVQRFSNALKTSQHIRLRSLRFAESKNELTRMKDIYESMLEPGFGFFPLTQEEFQYTVRLLRPLVALKPELSLVVEHHGEAVAFSVTVPEASEAVKAMGGRLTQYGLPWGLLKFLWLARRATRLRVLLFGIRPGFRRRGLDALLATETMRRARELGYESAELGWMAEDNSLLNRTVQATGAQCVKRFRIYQRALGSG